MEGNPYINENKYASLGFIASIVFLALCIYLIYTFIKKKGTLFYDFCSLTVLCCVLFATVGGFGAIFNFLVTPEIRAYNRISIYIMCICLIAMAVFINAAEWKKWIKYCVLIVLIVVARYDQIVISDEDVWTVNEEIAEVNSEFYSAIEAKMEPDSMIYQIPFREFPETAVIEGLGPYNQLEAYVFTDTLQWSHGGIKGRNVTAQELYIDDGMSREFIDDIVSQGFQGVCVDLRGYSAEMDAKVISFYSDTLGLEPIISLDGTRYFYDLSDLKS